MPALFQNRHLRVRQASLTETAPSHPARIAQLASYWAWFATALFFGGAPAWADNEHRAPALPATVSIGTSALNHQRLGLFLGTKFTLTTGRCTDCQTPPQALWYFRDEVIAIPADTTVQAGIGQYQTPPFLVWVGSPEIIDQATLTTDHSHLALPVGSTIPLRLISKLPTNQSYYNEATASFFGSRPLRLRGQTVPSPGGAEFEARMIWPLDFLITRDHTTTIPANNHAIPQLIEATSTDSPDTIATHILWERGNATWAGKPVLGAILNGAQGDDDEAHGGHFGIVTGRVGPRGEWADWLVNNFYDPDVVSEKGILPAMVPMDNYLMDLNSGQSYYRPSELLVLVLKQDRVPVAYQSAIQDVFRRFYRHELDYDHSLLNCAGLSIDQIRALGWQIPFQGPGTWLKAIGGYFYMAAQDRSLASGQKVYQYFSQEVTRLLPRVTYESIGTDLLTLLQPSEALRKLTPFEQWLVEDVEAVLYVHIPQIPSSRARGTYPVATLDEYQQRVPSDRSKWKTIAVPPRPFPAELRVGPASVEATAIPKPILALVLILSLGLLWIGTMLCRRLTHPPRTNP
jgi:hypothetical protein